MRPIAGFCFGILFGLCSSALAQNVPANPGCRQTAVQIEARGTAYVQSARAQQRPLANSMVQRSQGGFRLRGNGQGSTSIQARLQIEAYYRPLADGDFRLPVFPLLGARVSRDRDLVHVCADVDLERSRLVVHFLRAYNVSGGLPSFDEVIRGREMRVRPVPVTILGVSDLLSVVGRPFRGIPLIGWLVSLPSDAVRDLGQALGQTISIFSGSGIERLTLDGDVLELAYGIDRNDPVRARVSRQIYLRSADGRSAAPAIRVEVPATSER